MGPEETYSKDPGTARVRSVSQQEGAVVALFPGWASAMEAVVELKAAGFTGDQICVVLREEVEQGLFMEDTVYTCNEHASVGFERTKKDQEKDEPGSQMAEGTVSGMISGGLVGALGGLLIGMGVVVLPGFDPVVAEGMLATLFGIAGGTMVAGAGIGATTGGVVGGLFGLNLPGDSEEPHAETRLHPKEVFVLVKPGGRTQNVLQILKRHGGDVSLRARRAA